MLAGSRKPLLVMKFGGTSVGSAERIRRVAELVAQPLETRTVAVVVSAMSGVTDLLLQVLRKAEAGEEPAVESDVATLRQRHEDACRELLPAEKQPAVLQQVNALVDRFERVARGTLLLGHCPLQSADDAVVTGEKLTALLLSSLLEAKGVPSEAVNGAETIVTDGNFGGATPLMEETATRARARLQPVFESGRVPVVTGFNGATREGQPTTLGRGGSDFSASLLAAALDAAELWIWTDVSGILSGDPRVVSDARILPEVTYNEAAELAYNGAKVLHPRTLAPLIEKRIPVWIKNSFEPSHPGTKIGSRITDGCGVRAITSLGKVSLISIEAVSSSFSGAQLMARALEAAARTGTEVLLLTRSSFRQNFCMLVRSEELAEVMESLRAELSLELAHGYVHPIEVDDSVGLVAAVGEGMRGTPGLARQVFTALSDEKINIIAIAQGSSEITIAIVIRQDTLEAAVRALHASCGLGAPQPSPAKV